LPVVLLDCAIWSSEILILLSEIQSWDEENEDSDDEWDQKSQRFITNKDSESFTFSIEESGTHSRNVKEHGDTDLY